MAMFNSYVSHYQRVEAEDFNHPRFGVEPGPSWTQFWLG